MSHEYLGMPTTRPTNHRLLKAFGGLRFSVLLAIGLTVALGCKKKEGDSGGTALNAASSDTNNQSSDVSLPVVGEPARRGDLVLYVPTVGTIKSDIIEVKALAGGPVTQVRVRAGQTVRKGDTLALVDPRDLDIAV